MVNRLAHGLLAAGAQPGERLVWCGPNSLEVLATIHAARKLDLVAVPLSYRFNAEEMAYVIDNSDATTVVVDAEQAPLVADGPRRAPEGAHGRRVRRRRARRAARRWDDVLAGQPDTEPDVAPTQRSRRGDDLHVGHDRQAEGRAAHAHRPRRSCSRCSPS